MAVIPSLREGSLTTGPEDERLSDAIRAATSTDGMIAADAPVEYAFVSRIVKRCETLNGQLRGSIST